MLLTIIITSFCALEPSGRECLQVIFQHDNSFFESSFPSRSLPIPSNGKDRRPTIYSYVVFSVSKSPHGGQDALQNLLSRNRTGRPGRPVFENPTEQVALSRLVVSERARCGAEGVPLFAVSRFVARSFCSVPNEHGVSPGFCRPSAISWNGSALSHSGFSSWACWFQS